MPKHPVADYKTPASFTIFASAAANATVSAATDISAANAIPTQPLAFLSYITKELIRADLDSKCKDNKPLILQKINTFLQVQCRLTWIENMMFQFLAYALEKELNKVSESQARKRVIDTLDPTYLDVYEENTSVRMVAEILLIRFSHALDKLPRLEKLAEASRFARLVLAELCPEKRSALLTALSEEKYQPAIYELFQELLKNNRFEDAKIFPELIRYPNARWLLANHYLALANSEKFTESKRSEYGDIGKKLISESIIPGSYDAYVYMSCVLAKSGSAKDLEYGFDLLKRAVKVNYPLACNYRNVSGEMRQNVC